MVNMGRSMVNIFWLKEHVVDQMSPLFCKMLTFDLPHVLISAEPCIAPPPPKQKKVDQRATRQIKGPTFGANLQFSFGTINSN